MQQMPVVLSIAGSDSGGGAGIQADLKTFAALGVFGTTAITAVTAQNSVGVHRVDAMSPESVRTQIDAVASDFPVAAVKIGMLANTGIIRAVAAALSGLQPGPVVLDPVCVAGSGDPLLEGDALSALRELLLPLATVLTPNLAEGALLLERPALGETDAELVEAAQALIGLGPSAVLLKGGHRAGDADDVLVDADGELVLEAERIANNASHGTGCSLSSAVAALLARGRTVREASVEGKEFVRRGIVDAMQLGGGQSNLHLFWEYYGNEGLP
jgi:hydroxymethylpyrimidine/phosphomethylpyrimidine kinase